MATKKKPAAAPKSNRDVVAEMFGATRADTPENELRVLADLVIDAHAALANADDASRRRIRDSAHRAVLAFKDNGWKPARYTRVQAWLFYALRSATLVVDQPQVECVTANIVTMTVHGFTEVRKLPNTPDSTIRAAVVAFAKKRQSSRDKEAINACARAFRCAWSTTSALGQSLSHWRRDNPARDIG